MKTLLTKLAYWEVGLKSFTTSKQYRNISCFFIYSSLSL